jgi:hypothetical protein
VCGGEMAGTVGGQGGRGVTGGGRHPQLTPGCARGAPGSSRAAAGARFTLCEAPRVWVGWCGRGQAVCAGGEVWVWSHAHPPSHMSLVPVRRFPLWSGCRCQVAGERGGEGGSNPPLCCCLGSLPPQPPPASCHVALYRMVLPMAAFGCQQTATCSLHASCGLCTWKSSPTKTSKGKAQVGCVRSTWRAMCLGHLLPQEPSFMVQQGACPHSWQQHTEGDACTVLC